MKYNVNLEEYVEGMVRAGYWCNEDLEPLKCVHCDSKNLEDTDHIVEELGTHVTTEYRKVCKDCGKEVGYWSYGNWQI